MNSESLIGKAIEVLSQNDRGDHTVPAKDLYPHQWLWDSCFIAIGLRHYDIVRAQQELLSLLKGQWSNGMMPNMILSREKGAVRHKPELWQSNLSPYSPDSVPTSGITQPPMLAEAVVKIGKKLPLRERRSWYRRMYKAIVKYHEWLYYERDPHNEGLSLQIHSWETGLDNTPPWMNELHEHQQAFWIRFVHAAKLEFIFTLLRQDRKFALPGERLSTLDGLILYSIQRRLRRKAYDIKRIINHSQVAIEDLTFNCILIRANKMLQTIAKTIGEELPEELLKRMRKTENALEDLWDEHTGQYYSRNFASHDLIKIPSIATFMPLYAGCISKDRAKKLVDLLKSPSYSTRYPIPTVPTNSDWFQEKVYWQGPTWMNTNWLVIQGLENYGFKEAAEHVKQQSIKLVEKNGFCEYFSPKDGEPAGTEDFSWTAALIIDLLQS